MILGVSNSPKRRASNLPRSDIETETGIAPCPNKAMKEPVGTYITP